MTISDKVAQIKLHEKIRQAVTQGIMAYQPGATLESIHGLRSAIMSELGKVTEIFAPAAPSVPIKMVVAETPATKRPKRRT